MTLAAVAPILPELGPPGWIALGVLGLGAAGYAGYKWYTSPSDSALATDNANDRAKDLSPTAVDKPCQDCPCERTVIISRGASPRTAQHIFDAQTLGYPSVLTLDRPGAAARRAASLKGVATAAGMDRDEYPPAVFAEGGAGASVRLVPRSDNRSAGGQMAAQLSGAKDGCKITMTVGP